MAFISGKDAKLVVKQFDLSTYFQEVVSGSAADEIDVTTFGSAFRSFIGGLADGSMTLSGFFDPTAIAGGVGGSDAVLNDALDDPAPFATTFFPAGFATIGNPAFLLKAVEARYETGASIGAAVPAAAALAGAGGTRWGRVLATGAAVTPSATVVNNTGHDNPQQAATTKGLSAHIHALSNSYNQITTVRIEHSADDTTYTNDLGPAGAPLQTTFAATTVGAARLEVPIGTSIKRYVRLSYVGSAGTGTIAILGAFSRGF